jgi:hypothetical protein
MNLHSFIQYYAWKRNSELEFVERKKLGVKKAKREALKERQKQPRLIQ